MDPSGYRRDALDQVLRFASEGASEIVKVVGPDGVLRYAGPAFGRILGHDPGEAVGRMNVFDHVHPDDLPRVLEETEKALSAGGAGTEAVEYRFRHGDGSWRWMEGAGAHLTGDPAVRGIVVTARDVTARKEAEEALREAEVRYRTLVERIPAVTYTDRADGSFETVYTSPQIEGLLGYTPEEWVGGELWEKRLHPDDRERILAADEGLEVRGEPFAEEYRLLARDGSVVWVREEAVLVRDGEGEPLFWQGVIHDVTQRVEVERALRESEERFRGAFEDAPIGVALVGLPSPSSGSDRRYLRVNRALCEMLGYTEEQLLSLSTPDVTHPDDLEKSRARVERLLGEGGSKYTLEKRYVRSDGRAVWALLNVSLVRDPEGVPDHFVCQLQDVTGRKALEDRLKHQSLHDPLTGLPNRRLFMDRLRQALGRTRGRTGRRGGRRVAVLFVDLDNFKGVNDSLGHGAGDLLIAAAAERIGGRLRPGDTLARFGGDEFALIVEGVGSPEGAVRVAERVVGGFADPFSVGGRELYARASVGIALGGARGKTPEDLLRDADTAMYRAKESGAGYRVFDPAMHERALGRLETENSLRRAVERNEFAVRYQPIVRLDGGGVCTVEALARWEHPERGLLGPGEFVPLAEESGLIVPIGEQVLLEACRTVKRWQEEHPTMPPLVVSVNLSARQLARPDLADTVGRALQETGLEARCLSLDVTETAYVGALEGNAGALSRLRGMGVGVSIDDFGTGYSSLSYLKRLPADVLKIDRSFVSGLGEDVGDEAIVGMVVGLAHTLGMEAVAEGVETEAQAGLLRGMGCDMAQGFRFAGPLPPEEVPRFLAGRRPPG